MDGEPGNLVGFPFRLPKAHHVWEVAMELIKAFCGDAGPILEATAGGLVGRVFPFGRPATNGTNGTSECLKLVVDLKSP